MGWPNVRYQSPSTSSTCTACSSSAGWTGSGASFLPQQETSASPVVVMMFPQAGQIRNAVRFMVPPWASSGESEPASSVSTGHPSSAASAGKSDTSGQPPPRSHFDTALSPTPTSWASWSCVSPRSSRRLRMSPPVRLVSMVLLP